MTEYIITKEQIEELNRAHGGMKIVTSWLSCYAIWDTSNTYPVMKSEHVAVDLPERRLLRVGRTEKRMSEYPTGYRCNLCGEEYWSANETVATIRRKKYKNDAVTTTVWEFHVCDECLKKLVVGE